MAGSHSEVDNANNIQKFISKMNLSSRSDTAPSVQEPSTPTPNCPTASTDESNSEITPVSVPSRPATADKTPTRTAASPEIHPCPSPHVSGLLAPQNTPHTRPASPLSMSTNLQRHNEKVGEAISDFVNNLEGKPLSESYWAPKNVAARATAARGGSLKGSKNLTATKVVNCDPSINASFSRMSFKAADSDKSDGIIFGEHNTRSAFSSLGSKKPSTIDRVQAKPSDQMDSNTATKPFKDDSLINNLREIEACGELSSEHIALLKAITDQVVKDANRPTDVDDIDQPIFGKSVAKTPSKNVDFDGVDTIINSTGNAEQTTPNKEHVSEPESNGSHMARTKAIYKLRETLRLKEKSLEDFYSKWEAEKHKQEVGLKKLRRELAELNKLITLAESEKEAFDKINTIEAATLSKVVQDHRHELRLVEGDSRAIDGSSPQKKAEIEEGTDVSRVQLQKSEPKEATSKPIAATNSSKCIIDRVTNYQASPRARVSGPTNAKSKDAVKGSPLKHVHEEYLEHETFFEKWPQLEKRDRAPARFRKVILKNLPSRATPAFVASIVYFGPLEEISMRGDNSATVKFLHPEDCSRYFEDTSNGVVYGKDANGAEKVVFVELAKDVDVVGGLLQGWIDLGATRCVRVIGVDEDRGIAAMIKLAEEKGRVIEGMADTKTPDDSRMVIFRFVKIDHAVNFKATLVRMEDWEHCNISFGKDPCEIATKVHSNQSMLRRSK